MPPDEVRSRKFPSFVWYGATGYGHKINLLAIAPPILRKTVCDPHVISATHYWARSKTKSLSTRRDARLDQKRLTKSVLKL